MNSCNSCLKIFFQISLPRSCNPCFKVWLVTARHKEKLTKFTRSGKNMQPSWNERLTYLHASQAVSCVGKAYGIAVGGCCSHIAFVVNNQALTLVGTPCAVVVGASWHGAREEEIEELKK
jgi:hypothetical protein